MVYVNVEKRMSTSLPGFLLSDIVGHIITILKWFPMAKCYITCIVLYF